METNKIQWYVLFIVILAYVFLLVFSPEKGNEALKNSIELLERILPFLLLVLALMIIFNYLFPVKVIVGYMGRNSGIRGWIIAIIAGLVSVGPAYLWYRLLRRLMEEGTGYGPVAAFLYARAIKIQFIPLMVVYFGLEYVGILFGVMILASVVIGILMELIMGLLYPMYRQ